MKIMRRIVPWLLSLCIVICSSSVVLAAGQESSVGDLDLDPMDDWVYSTDWDNVPDLLRGALSLGLKRWGCYMSGDLYDKFLNAAFGKILGKTVSDYSQVVGDDLIAAAEYVYGKRYVSSSSGGVKYTGAHIKPLFRDDEDDYVLHDGGSLRRDLSYEADDEFMDLVKESADEVIKDNAGFYYVPTYTPSVIDVSWFQSRSTYDKFVNNLKSYLNGGHILSVLIFDSDFPVSGQNYISDGAYVNYAFLDDCYVVCSNPDAFTGDSYYSGHNIFTYDRDTWNRGIFVSTACTSSSVSEYDYCTLGDHVDISYLYNNKEFVDSFTFYFPSDKSYYLSFYFSLCKLIGPNNVHRSYLSGTFSADGRPLKVFKTVDDFKRYEVGKQPYYITSNYTNYDSSQDNSVTFNGDYFADNSTVNYYNVIQDEIADAGEGLTESDVQRIVDEVYERFLAGGSGSGSGDGGASGGNSSGGSGGSGLGDFFDGLGSLVDFVLRLVGGLVNLIADLGSGILDILGSLTQFTDGFGLFLKEAYSWLPEEAVDIITLGISTIVVLAIIRAVRGFF